VRPLQQHVVETDVLSSSIPSVVQLCLKRLTTPVRIKHGQCQPESQTQRSTYLVLVAVAFHWEQHMDLVLVEVLQLARMQLLLHKY
jgi:hypothetical protein